MAKVRDRHVGGGHYELTEGELGYAAYASVRQSATTSARVTGQAGFDGMGITTTTSGEVTNGPSLGDGWVIHRLYFLGLARYLRPGTGAEARIQTFYRWLRWRGFTGASLANYRYMSVTGNAFMMTSDLIPVEDRAYFLNSLWSVTYRDGTLHTLATTGSRDPQALERFRNADVLRSCMHLVLAGILILPETTSAQREVKLAYLAAYRRTIIWAADAAPGIASLLKPDFSGHHHYTSYAAAYSPYGALALAGTAELFRGTPYQLADHHLTHLAGYARELYFYAHLDHTPQGLSGRGESSQSLTEAYSILALMALAGSTPRSDLLQVIANTNGATRITERYDPTYIMNAVGMPHHVVLRARACQEIQARGMTPTPLTGVRTYPYAALAAMRQDNWVLTIKGFSRWWHTYEGGRTSTNPVNLYGVYDCHGVVELHYFPEDNSLAGPTLNPLDRTTMDMAHRAGATTPIRTHEQMFNDSIDSRLKMNSTSVGAVHLRNTHGIFMFDMKNLSTRTRDPSLKAKKSSFMFGNRVMMLGSGIAYQNANSYPLHTTLYQNKLTASDRSQSPIWNNASTPITEDRYATSGTTGAGGHVLVDADGTGYYLAQGQQVHVERTLTDVVTPTSTPTQNLRSGAYRSLAWLDHGINPTDASYEYVMVPNADYAEMETFRAQQADQAIYTVLERSARAHIIRDHALHLWGYALYEDFTDDQRGPLLGVSVQTALPHVDTGMPANPGYGVIIDDSHENQLDVGLSYLDLRLHKTYYDGYGAGTEAGKASAGAIVRMTVRGLWLHEGDADGGPVTVSHTASGDTVLDITCTHGASRQLTLIQADSLGGSLSALTNAYQANEGNAGTTPITVTFTRTGGSIGAKVMTFATVADSAHANDDFVPSAGTLHWEDGDTVDKTITISLQGDFTVEADESFQVVYQELGTDQTPGPTHTVQVTIVNDDQTAPTILTQPQSVTVIRGSDVSLSVVASGTTLRYQWYLGVSGDISRAVPGGTSSSYTVTEVSADTFIWVLVSNDAGQIESHTALVQVLDAPPSAGNEGSVAKSTEEGGPGGCGNGGLLSLLLALGTRVLAGTRGRSRAPRDSANDDP